MEGTRFQEQLQERIARWLKSGDSSGLTSLESETVVLGSALGKRSENQDRTIFLRVKFDEPSKPSLAALILCDGMGGMISGGDCANLAVSTFASSLINTNIINLSEKLKVAVNAANQAVYKAFQGRGGATLSAVVGNDLGAWAAVNVGDSRIYRVLHSGLIEQLTIDDTLEKQLADLNLPDPPPEFRQLLQYIGMGEGINPRHIDLQLSAEIKWFLITSDGAHGISEATFKALVSCAESPKEVVVRLNQLSGWLGGKDNSTVSVLAVAKDLFSSIREAAFSSLELWSIPGKAEFFSNKTFQTDASKNTTSVKAKDASGVNKPSRGDNNSHPQKPSKRKNQNNSQNVEPVNGNGSKPRKDKAETNELVPQLNIEFSGEN